jgi:hypothetical protein
MKSAGVNYGLPFVVLGNDLLCIDDYADALKVARIARLSKRWVAGVRV